MITRLQQTAKIILLKERLKKMSLKIAIIGAENSIGQDILTHISEKEISVDTVYAACEDKTQTKPVSFGDKDLTMIHVDKVPFTDLDIIFLAGTPYGAQKVIEKASSTDAKIIDLTKTDGKTLSIPDLDDTAPKNAKLIGAPCSSTIQLLTALKPLNTLGKIDKVIISTYQSVSEIGRPAMDELFNQMRSIYMNHEPKTQNFTKQIAFNAIPQVGDFEDNHGTSQEERIIQEFQNISETETEIACTCVYVPTFVAHAQSVTVLFKENVSVKDAKSAWREAKNIEIIDLESEMEYVTPSEIHGESNVFLSRIRQNDTMKNSLSFWSVLDNIQAGAAYNAVRIAEELTK